MWEKIIFHKDINFKKVLKKTFFQHLNIMLQV